MKYYKAEDVLAILSEEERPLNWTDSESEIQAENDFDNYKAMIESLPTIEVSKDCISRKWLEENKQVVSHTNEWGETEINEYIYREDVEDAPSVVPTTEQYSKVGEWIDWLGKGNEWECSECKCSIESHGSIAYKYCPNCGAKMKGTDDDI